MILLEKERYDARLSKRKLAMETGVDASFIVYAEQRGFQLYPAQLEKLAAGLGYKGDPADLLKEVQA